MRSLVRALIQHKWCHLQKRSETKCAQRVDRETSKAPSSTLATLWLTRWLPFSQGWFAEPNQRPVSEYLSENVAPRTPEVLQGLINPKTGRALSLTDRACLSPSRNQDRKEHQASATIVFLVVEARTNEDPCDGWF